MINNVKERVLEAMKEWDVNRLRSELEAYIMSDSAPSLEESFFDDIATEEEYEEKFKEEL